MSNILGNNINKYRTERGMSQEKLADSVGVSRQAVSLWELGTVVPNTSRLIEICRVLHVTSDELLNSSSDNSSENFDVTVDIDDIREKLKAIRAESEDSEENKSCNNNDIDKKNVDEISTDIIESTEQENESNTEIEEPKTIPVARNINKFKKFRKIIVIAFIVLFIIYLAYSLYKFIVLTYVTSKIQKYENLDNYYFKIMDYGDENLNYELKVWYKDGIYKIIHTVNENNKLQSYTSWIDTNTYTKYELNNQDNSILENKYSKENNEITNNYINGKYLYLNFPDYIKKEKINIFLLSIQFNKIYLKVNKDTVNYYFNDFSMQFDNKTFLPKTESKNFTSDKDSGVRGIKYYDIILNAVKDSDINVVRN